MTDGTEASVKRRQITVEELRRRMLDAALEMVGDNGLTVGLSHLNMEEIIRLAGVPRSSVYREWDTKEDFYVELMIALVEPGPAQAKAFDVETLRLAAEVVSDNVERLTTRGGRHAVLAEAIRVAGERNFQALNESLTYRTVTALVAALPTFDDAQREKIAKALTDSEVYYPERVAQFYKMFLPLMGFRVRDGFSERQLAIASASVVEGMTRRSFTTPDIVSAPVIYPGIDGEPVNWHFAALTLLGVVEFMIEPIADWLPE
ncbi:TetR/AcrR family transcriptional regulator [Gordonia sp. CPCC 205333]|uniref:TetR/AcrR family transcriptional regulator n=1 Tax=Gordonia sp. CPCC 205333 TaxID=3140790 RepID=UPI003AF3B7B6